MILQAQPCAMMRDYARMYTLKRGSIVAAEQCLFAQRTGEDLVFVQLLISARTKNHFFAGWVKPEEPVGFVPHPNLRKKQMFTKKNMHKGEPNRFMVQDFCSGTHQ